MNFLKVVAALGPLRVIGKGDPRLTGIAEDSRKVKPGDLFICIPGAVSDGRKFALEAVQKGAAALVVEKNPLENPGVPQALVTDSREALAHAAHLFHGSPSRKVKVIGVTGTKGKTTTTYLIRSILERAGKKTGLIGTIAYRIGDKSYPAPNTTPSALTIAELLAEMKREGCGWAAMEVSSHALEMKRVLDLEFQGAVFTNLGRDHLDYHRTFGNYFKAKRRLFREFKTVKAKVVNADDAYGKKLLRELGREAEGYGLKTPCSYRGEKVDVQPGKIRFEVQGRKFEAPLTGLFNVYNSLAAIAVLRELGIGWKTLQEGLAHAPAVPGRFEEVKGGQDFTVLVDYAHTADALEQALKAARQLIEGKSQKLISVFGCGGDRDKTKRPLMGEVSSRLADMTVVTSDNPRSEKPEAILADILRGIPPAKMQDGRRRVWVEKDRGRAIRLALSMARKGDVVLIAGKGHETYQIIGREKLPFDDRKEALKALKVKSPSGGRGGETPRHSSVLGAGRLAGNAAF